MKATVLYRRNPTEVVETTDLVSIAKDMVKVGEITKAETLLAGEGGMEDGAIARVLFRAVEEELASGNRREVRKLFNKIRKKYRTQELPVRLRDLVTYNEKTVREDMEIALANTRVEVELQAKVSGVYDVTSGREEYQVVRDNDVAEEMALERVKDDLTHEPGIFNQDWLQYYLDDEVFTRKVREMALDHDYWNEADDRDVMRAADQYGVEYEEDEDGDLVDGDDVRDKVAEAQADDRARDPRGFLDEIMDQEQVSEWIRDNVPIDIEAAAKAAVNENGAGNFLSSYDGNLWETVSGFTYWRVN